MKTLTILMFTLLVVTVISYLSYSEFLARYYSNNKSSLNVNTPYQDTGVYINNNYAGPTPFIKDDLSPGEITLKVGEWVQKVTLTVGAQTVINQDLGPEPFSGGDVIWLTAEKGEPALMAVSTPAGAEITIDDQVAGVTPFRTDQMPAGEHTITLKKEGYINRQVRVQLQKNHTLNLVSTLMLNPLPETITYLPTPAESIKLINLSNDNQSLKDRIEEWAKGCAFYYRSLGIADTDRPRYYLSSGGIFFDENADKVPLEKYPKILPNQKMTIAYLGEATKGTLPVAVSDTIAKITSNIVNQSNPKVEILPTGTGALGVRSGAGIDFPEIKTVKVGEDFDLLEEKDGWVRIRFEGGSEGWAQASSVKRL